MISATPDKRLIGVNQDFQNPGTSAFNTWRHLGADAERKVQDIGVKQADAIRRVSSRLEPGGPIDTPG